MNGAEALRMIETNSAIDLLFTDVVMRRHERARLADEVARRRPAVRMFSSGYTQNAI